MIGRHIKYEMCFTITCYSHAAPVYSNPKLLIFISNVGPARLAKLGLKGKLCDLERISSKGRIVGITERRE